MMEKNIFRKRKRGQMEMLGIAVIVVFLALGYSLW